MIKRALPHICLVIALMMLVFYTLDRYNGAMNFIDNDIFKMLLLVFSLLVIVSSILTIRDHRRSARHREQIWREKAAARSGAVQPVKNKPQHGQQTQPSEMKQTQPSEMKQTQPPEMNRKKPRK